MGLFNFGKPKDEALEAKLEKIREQIKEEQGKLEAIKQEIQLANDELGLQEYGFFERQYKFSSSVQYKEKLDELRNRQKELVKSNKAGEILQAMMLDNSAAKGKTMQNQLIKAALRGFNGECDAFLTKITVSNVDNKIKALQKAFEQINKMYARSQVGLSRQYLALKIEELRVAAEYELQKQEEKELLKEQREKEREDQKLQAEIAKQRKQIAKDRTHFQQMVGNVEKMLETASADELDNLKAQLQEYQNKLNELDQFEEDIDYREGHATAGYVYIISNIGSFGEDVYKIGVTRRLEPLERIRELGSASVPFQFDVHALIFSEEAFALETELHNELAAFKVNKVNNRKEYFKAPFSKIKEVLDKHKELAIELTETAEAFEYRQGLLNKKG